VEVRLATPERVDVFGELFGRTFADDGIVTWPFPLGDGAELARRQWRSIGPGMIAAGWVWEVPDAAGFATWVPPDGDERYLGIELTSRDDIRSLTDDAGARLGTLWDLIESRLPDEPHWYLDLIAVAPERQGQGVGSALIRFGLELAARDGVCAFLETSRRRNVDVYEHLGFRVVQTDELPDGGPFLRFMRWDPA
jgi:GNAT superfamily N-acetyltransferase